MIKILVSNAKGTHNSCNYQAFRMKSDSSANVNQFNLLGKSICFTQQINLIYFAIQIDLQMLP